MGACWNRNVRQQIGYKQYILIAKKLHTQAFTHECTTTIVRDVDKQDQMILLNFCWPIQVQKQTTEGLS